jgi:hypothetical protein
MPTSWAIHIYSRRTMKPMQLNGQERRLQHNLIHCKLKQSECRRYTSQCWRGLLILFCVRLLGFLHGVKGCGVNTSFSCIKKDDDLVVLIRTSKVAYTKEVCVTWDSKHENQGPSKTSQLKEMQPFASYHGSKIIHG